MGKAKKIKADHDNQTNSKDIKRLFKVFGLSLLIVILLVAAVSFITNNTDWNIFGSKDRTDDVEDGVIYRIDSDAVRSIHPYQNGVVLLTNAAVQYLDQSGRTISSNKHSFASPEMQISDKTVFLFDKGGTGCRIEKNASVYQEITAPGVITCGAIGKRGNYAYSIDNHEGYQ